MIHGTNGSDFLTKDKLHGYTTHSIPRSMAKTGNPLNKRLNGLLEKELQGSLMGLLCATLSLISDKELKEDTEKGSAFNYRDNKLSPDIYPSVFFAHQNFYPNKIDSASKHIDTFIIPTGAEIIISTRVDEICDLFINVLSD